MQKWVVDELYLWVKAALECESWRWDDDQREAAQAVVTAYENKRAIDEFYAELIYYTSKGHKERWGQSVFNVMAKLYPNIAEEFKGGEKDPFHNDDAIEDFIASCFKKINKNN